MTLLVGKNSFEYLRNRNKLTTLFTNLTQIVTQIFRSEISQMTLL